MVDRIQKVIQIKKLTSSKFADLVGVPRSTISHILSGRNNPSLEFLMKILDAFPDINTTWLVRGEGAMQTVSNSLFREEDFLPDESEAQKSKENSLEGPQKTVKKNDDLSKDITENQISKSGDYTTIPSHTAHIPESPYREAIKSPSNDDIIEEDSSKKRKNVDAGLNPEENFKKVAKAMESDKKLAENKKAEKIIIIYHDGTFSEHIPSS
jgi:transcriptional regulator with XRE-family HTH domain